MSDNNAQETIKILVLSDNYSHEALFDPAVRIVEVDEAIYLRKMGDTIGDFLDENPEAIISQVSLNDLVPELVNDWE